MSIKTGDEVRLKRDIKRIVEPVIHYQDGYPVARNPDLWLPYASEGDTGIVKETFRNDGEYPWYAKVIMDGQIKTFRLTSLEQI